MVNIKDLDFESLAGEWAIVRFNHRQAWSFCLMGGGQRRDLVGEYDTARKNEEKFYERIGMEQKEFLSIVCDLGLITTAERDLY